ncbi:MAG: hypothetical protein JRH16_22310 [Deltaproteobacteria bacterium]|nr:hypothetical protein [Deltaproteobacteria bacterium]MBW2416052.1 hypothetical protein [Deltaproteobacteria bacterium]
MTALDYETKQLAYQGAPVVVREDLVEAHRRAWRRIAEPGTWWTGEQRVAIAAETRNALSCSLCRERKQALSPNAVEGEHQSLGGLPAPVVDVIHRVRTDPGRLSKRWFEQIRAAGVGDAEYVETISVVVTLTSIDFFCRAIGTAAHPLPAPVAGEPARHRPQGARPEGAWVPMIAHANATGPEADLYGVHRYPNVGRALSLVPDEVRGLVDLMTAQYMPVHQVARASDDPGRAIDRAQMELIAGRVSALNECFY